jgi:hypothetical protein
MGKAVLLVAAVAALVAGCGGAAKPRFRTARGWHAITEPGQIVSAANVRFASADRSQSEPNRTIASLPRYGVVIWVEWLRPSQVHGSGQLYPRRSLPLRVEDATYPGAPEGSTCPATAPSCFVGHLSASEAGWVFEVWIFFGTANPLPEDIAAADAELARLRLPDAQPASAKAPVKCPKLTGTRYYDTSVRPSSGPVGTNVVVSGRLPASSSVTAYWNLDFAHWPTISTPAPEAAAAGWPVHFVGMRNVAGECSYRLRVKIPAVAPGRYPIEVLYGTARFGASFAPVEFRVTSG